MTLEEAIGLFDRVLPIDTAWRTVDGIQIGVPYCCEAPVVQSIWQPGAIRLYCEECGREIKRVGQEWVVNDWGRKGIDLLRFNGALLMAACMTIERAKVPENLDIAPESSGGGGADSGQCDDAESLRAQIKEMSGFTDALMTSQELAAENPRVLEAEIERLRAALQLIADTRDGTLNNAPRLWLSQCVEIARAALERKP